MRPVRVQLSRKKGWRMPPNTVKVDRSTKWGNPFVPGKDATYMPGRKVQDGRDAVSLFVGFAPQNEKLVKAAIAELKGKNLACWCHLCDLHRESGKEVGNSCPWCEPCHADVLLQIANVEPRGI